MNATDEARAAFDAVRALPGWTAKWLDSGDYRVTSPTGMGLVPPTITHENCQQVLTTLNNLGLQHDLHHRLIPTPPPAVHHDITHHEETELTDVPVATKTARSAKPRVIRFDIPDEPQKLTLEQLLPSAYAGRGRCMLPRVIIDVQTAAALYELRASDKDKNRNLRPSNKRKFIRLIMQKLFDYTHQGVAFNEAGLCADGQHRFAALMEVGEQKPNAFIVVDITYNIPAATARAYDGGAARNNVDRLTVAGIANAAKVSQLVRLLYQYKEATDYQTKHKKTRSWKEIEPIPPDVLEKWSKRLGGQLLADLEAVRGPLKKVDVNLNVAAVARYLAVEAWTDAPFDDFIEALGEPTSRKRGTPQRALEEWLFNNRKDKRFATTQRVLAMFLVAYNDFCVNRGREQMKWLPSSGMPMPYTPDKK